MEKFGKKLPQDLCFLNLVSEFIKKDENVPNAERIKKAFTEDIVGSQI